MSRRAEGALRLSGRARGIEISPTVAMSQRAAAQAARGERVLDFSVGEPDQATPAPIRAAAIAALKAGRTRYTPSAGIPELRAAVARRYQRDFKVSFAPSEVVVTSGGKHALYVACQALLERGDEVVVPSPYWPTFTEAVRLAGGRAVLAPAHERDGFRITARLVRAALTPWTKAVIVNTPCNPTGAVIEPQELLAIGELARRQGFAIFYDDTYANIRFGKVDTAPLRRLRETMPERLVILGTASKSYCMTGWRIGWIMGPKPLADAAAALISHSTQCPTTFAQVAAVTALTGPQKRVRDLAAEYRRRRDFIHPRVARIPGVSCVRPDGGFYLFPNLGNYLSPELPTTLALAGRLLEEKGVAVVPGEGFGLGGYARISFARSMGELREGVARIESFLAGLREA